MNDSISGMSDLRLLISLTEKQNDLIQQQIEIESKVLWEAQVNRRTQDVIRTAVTSPVLDDVQKYTNAHQLGFLETLDLIIEKNLSFARFGDGEMKLMLRPEYKLSFQSNSPELAKDLRSVFFSQIKDGLLIGFPHVYRDVHWSGVWSDIWGQVKPLFTTHTVVGNSHISRPIFFQSTGQTGVDAWRRVWQDKSISIVTGKDSRFEIIPELFDSAKSVSFQNSLPKNAYSDLGRILEKTAEIDADIILVSLGPTGTILVNELSKRGQRAIDIGHISDSYQNVFSGGEWPESKNLLRNS